MEEPEISLTRSKYEELLKCKCDLETLRNMLISGARLTHDRRHLGIDAGTVDTILHHVLGDEYGKKIVDLQTDNLLAAWNGIL